MRLASGDETQARRGSAQRQAFPRFYTSDKNQAVAECLAFNFWLDRLAGREPTPDVLPYSDFKRETVTGFLAKLSEMTDGNPIASIQAL